MGAMNRPSRFAVPSEWVQAIAMLVSHKMMVVRVRLVVADGMVPEGDPHPDEIRILFRSFKHFHASKLAKDRECILLFKKHNELQFWLKMFANTKHADAKLRRLGIPWRLHVVTVNPMGMEFPNTALPCITAREMREMARLIAESCGNDSPVVGESEAATAPDQTSDSPEAEPSGE